MREKVLAEVTVVDSRDAALEVIRTSVPDVLLLSALLSPRDEDELIAHLRTLDAQHLQTHTIPQLASALSPGEGRGGGGLLSAFRRKKKEPEVAPGCDPDLFAEEIRTYLKRAEDKKRELQSSFHKAPDMRLGPIKAQSAPAAASEAATDDGPESSSWDSPFEWKPSGSSSGARRAPARSAPPPEPVETAASVSNVSDGEPLILAREPESDASPLAEPEPSAPILAERDSDAALRAALIPEPGLPKTVSLIPNPESVIITAEDPIEYTAASRVEEPVPIDRDEPVVVMREPSIFTSQPGSVLTYDRRDAMTIEDPGDDVLPEITLVEDPIEIEERPSARYAAGAVDAAAETLIDLDAAPDEEPALDAPSTDRGFAYLDSGPAGSEWSFPLGDSGFVIQDRGSASRDRGVAPLASWARVEQSRNDNASANDDLRMLLAGLAVPSAVAGVRYARGCRIRRVRVPASQAADAGDTPGPVILSRRALAEQREQTT